MKYAVIDTGKAAADVQVTPDDLRAYYDQHRDQYRVPEQVKVSHILIKTPLPGPDGKVDEKGVAEAQRRAEDLLKQVKSGAKFEDLAKKYSEDPGSAKQGGSLGWIGKGQTVPEFEKTAFSLPKGQISDLVKSSYGFHIIRVDDKQDAHMKSLDEVKAEIEPILKHQKAQQIAQKKADTLLKQARAQGLDAAAAAQGISGNHFGLLRAQRHAAGTGTGAAVHGRGVRSGRKISAGCGSDFAGHRCVSVARGEAAGYSDVRRDSHPGRRGIQERALRRFCFRRRSRNSPTAPRPSTI